MQGDATGRRLVLGGGLPLVAYSKNMLLPLALTSKTHTVSGARCQFPFFCCQATFAVHFLLLEVISLSLSMNVCICYDNISISTTIKISQLELKRN